MAKALLNEPHFQHEAAAFAYVEARLWPTGPVCHHCGERERIGRLQGKTTRPGLYKCYACKKPFTVRMGTIFESSHLPLQLWLQIIHLMCASKKGISTNQIQRMLRCSMKTAWFLSHRIREAMNDKPGVFFSPIGGEGKTVEADETYIGRKASSRAYEAPGPKQSVMGPGRARRRGAQLPCPERDRQHAASDHREARPSGQPLHDRRIAHLHRTRLELRLAQNRHAHRQGVRSP
jgi:transposase-like protein